jgi:hypothetical protein
MKAVLILFHLLRRFAMRILLVFGLLLYIVAPTLAQDSTAQQTPERPAQISDQPPVDKLVLANVIVMTKERDYVTGLSKDAFSILDNKVPRKVTYFSEDEPISIAFLSIYQVQCVAEPFWITSILEQSSLWSTSLSLSKRAIHRTNIL